MFNIDISYGNGSHKPKTKKQQALDELMNVYVLDYDDNYHRFSDEPTSEEEKAVRKLRNRYRNVPDFVEAKRIYHEYMDTLYEYYGDKKTFKKYLSLGLVDHYIPNKPKLKNNKELKLLYKYCPTMKKMGKRVINDDNMDEYLSTVYPELNLVKHDDEDYFNREDREIEFVEIPVSKRDKNIEKLVDKGLHLSKTKFNRGYKKDKGFSYEVDFMSLGFALKNPKKYKKKKHQVAEDPNRILISDIMYAKPGEIIFIDEDEDELDSYRNLFRTSSYKEDVELFTNLANLGWDAYGMMKKGHYNKRTLNQFNPKKIKKKKKKAAKAEKKRNKRNDELNGWLTEAMFDSGYNIDDFDEFSKELLSMTSKDVFK